MAKILIIDDDDSICVLLSKLCQDEGHTADCAGTLQQGCEKAEAGRYDVVFLDVMLPDENGLRKISQICKTASHPEVIIMTGYGDPAGAELAINSGAWDYIEKSSPTSEMIFQLSKALKFRETKQAHKKTVFLDRVGIIGDSPQIKQCLDFVAQFADSDTSALISGETGTGKELFARAIHANSLRKDKPFVVLDCAALPNTLVESVLFGHKKGAFTGADSNREGLLSLADQGTLFLDEVGELPLSIQKDFLRALQERSFRPVGAEKEATSDFRVIAATNQDIRAMVEKGTFRKDLFFRLCVFELTIPSLEERMADIKPISQFHVTRLCEKQGIPIKGFASDFFDFLLTYTWPGNIRELINALDRAVTAALTEPILFPNHLPRYIRSAIAKSSLKNKKAPVQPNDTDLIHSFFPEGLPPFKTFKSALEEVYFKELFSISNGNMDLVSKISQMSKSQVYSLTNKYHIKKQPPTLHKKHDSDP